VYSPNATDQHVAIFQMAHGWSGDLSPYYQHRDVLQPNANFLHGLSALNAYWGISPSSSVDVVGDHNRKGFLSATSAMRPDGFHARPAFYDWLEALSVRWLLLPVPAITNRVERVSETPYTAVYRVNGMLPRARFAPHVRLVPSMDDALRLSAAGALDPRQEIVLQNAADVRSVEAAQSGPSGGPESASIVVDRATEVVIEANSTRGGLLVLADAFYPGWIAAVDGREQPVLRANGMMRGVALSPGTHRVVFQFRSKAVRLGWLLTATGLALLAGAALLLAFGRRTSNGTEKPTHG